MSWSRAPARSTASQSDAPALRTATLPAEEIEMQTRTSHSSEEAPSLKHDEDQPAPQNEHAPLLSPTHGPRDDEDPLDEDRDVLNEDYDEYQTTKSVFYLILATLSIGGLQIAWSVELSNGSPYLLSLGLNKSLMALVWIAGPLSGTLVQPYIGILSDSCRLRWGKRKPFMIAGALATIVSFLGLAWAREIVSTILGIFGVDKESEGVKVVTIIVAVIFVYILDFAINTVQAAIRAFMVDTVPTHQQEAANSWASRLTGVGNIVGYIAGYADLPKRMWFFGNTQFKVLCVIASLALGITVAISCLLVAERDPRLEGEPEKRQRGVVMFFKTVFKSIRTLPPQTKKVCETQFCVWIAWFPVLFYVSSWIAEIYVQPFLEANPNLTPAEVNKLYEQGTRVGTFGLLIYAITSLSANVLLPFFVAPSLSQKAANGNGKPTTQSRFEVAASKVLAKLIIPWLTLRRMWIISLLIMAGALFASFFVTSTVGATVIIGVIGIPWAMALWAPFAIISGEISRRDALRRSRRAGLAIEGEEELTDDQAGILLGIHNMSIAAPQILATLGSSLIFKIMQKPRGTPGDRSLGTVLAISGVFALIAAGIATRIAEESPDSAVPTPTSGFQQRMLRGDGYEAVERT